MQSVLNFTINRSIRRYGVPRLYRDLLKLNNQNVKDKNVRQNIRSTLKTGLRENWDAETMFNNPNVRYLASKSNLETHEKLGMLYRYIKDFISI